MILVKLAAPLGCKCVHTCGLLSFQRVGVVTLVFWFPAFVTAPMFKQ